MPDGSLNTTPEIFNGHLGNLTEEQERQLETFKEHLTKSKLYTPALSITDDDSSQGGQIRSASHDDPTLLYVGAE